MLQKGRKKRGRKGGREERWKIEELKGKMKHWNIFLIKFSERENEDNM